MSITIHKILHFIKKLCDIKKTFEKVTHFTPLHPTHPPLRHISKLNLPLNIPRFRRENWLCDNYGLDHSRFHACSQGEISLLGEKNLSHGHQYSTVHDHNRNLRILTKERTHNPHPPEKGLFFGHMQGRLARGSNAKTACNSNKAK